METELSISQIPPTIGFHVLFTVVSIFFPNSDFMVWLITRNITCIVRASIDYQAVTYGDVPEGVREKVRADLEKYCGRDTEAMIWIVDRLKGLCD
ncbi:hypothetical protein ACFLYR_08910 [Chloroflexota bacterium]